MTRLPWLATLLGLAGLLPFLACGFATVAQHAPWGLPALVGYGAVILGFIGAVHWGVALAPQTPGAGASPEVGRARLLLGAIPALVGWVALLIPSVAGLILLIAGYIAALVVEVAGHRRLLVPPGYMGLRWVLSIVVIAILVTVLVLHLIGARLLF
ncbi:MAG: DUF3429 domain-containing protein [Acetobacteraceae bacterium]